MLRPVRRPSPRLVRRLHVALLAAVAAGCGSSGPTAEQQVRSTVEAFGKASAAKDYQRLCDDLLAPKLVEKVESVGLPCEVAMRQGLGDVKAPTLTIGAIEVKGNEATAEVKSTAEGQEPSTDTMRLVRAAGGWRIAALD
jgi:hypothetical protein